MTYVIADNILSPLGQTSEENYLSVKTGKSMLHAYEAGSYEVQDGFCASLIGEGEDAENGMGHSAERMLKTPFERLAFASAKRAMLQSGIDFAHQRVLFILSTTKGAIEGLGALDDEEIFLGTIAQRIATALGIQTKPIVVCNACISGLSALILADRLLAADEKVAGCFGFDFVASGPTASYDYAVVCGADSPRRFIISGFQSLKALSTEPCRPFDMERFGLNLGEAAATIVLGRNEAESKRLAASRLSVGNGLSRKNAWQIGQGFIKNDAFHISAPSKTSEGLYACLQETLQGVNLEDIGFVNAHGTATLFNDQMESIAIQRAGLSEVPVNALKGYFGHTLGAAGIMETILCMKAAEDGIILGTRGFEELGVSGKMNISADNRSTENRFAEKPTFVKMLSGFGGCNATLLATQETEILKRRVKTEVYGSTSLIRSHHVKITTKGVIVDGNHLNINQDTGDTSMLTAIYKQYIGGYPKYYKMDGLSRLGFVASELLLKAEKVSQSPLGVPTKAEAIAKSPLGVPTDLQSGGKQGTGKIAKFPHEFDRAVILFNRSSSIASDKKYLASIADKDNYFPSPSIFVYTLPNIVTGEIAIRNGYHGETSFYVLADKDEAQMQEILQTAFMDTQTQSALTGWLDYEDSTHFEADLYIVELPSSRTSVE